MKTIKFLKMHGSGNDFVVIDTSNSRLGDQLKSHVVKLCDRIFGIGADGVLLLQRSKVADVRMRIFNADGSEAEMCGNGARCAALFFSRKKKLNKFILETKAGLINAQVKQDLVKIKLTDPSDIRLNLAVKSAGKEYEVDFINTGVPHAVIEMNSLSEIAVRDLGRFIRHHEIFKPAGTNVNFVQILDRNHILIRTYERGVEDETLACGTGSVASAIISVLNHCGEIPAGRSGIDHKVCVKTKSGEVLIVYFRVSKNKIDNVWLEGKANIVFKGEYCLG